MLELDKLLAEQKEISKALIDVCYNSTVSALRNCNSIEEAYRIKDEYYIIGKYENNFLAECKPYFENSLDKIDVAFEETIESINGSMSSEQNFMHFDNMDGNDFEKYCADILREKDYKNVITTSGSGDFGVDILAEKDGVKYAVQCKRSASCVGNTAIQEIFSGREFYKCHVGIVMTNNYFTKSALETAQKTGIVLWDRDWLLNNSTDSAGFRKEQSDRGIKSFFEYEPIASQTQKQGYESEQSYNCAICNNHYDSDTFLLGIKPETARRCMAPSEITHIFSSKAE